MTGLAFDYAGRSKETVAACNLCGSAEHVELSHRDRYGFEATLRMCVRCGLGFLSPRLTRDEYASFYAHAYRPLISQYHGRRIDAQTVQEGQRSYAEKLLRFLGRNLPPAPTGSLLDVGGSTGVVAGAVATALGADATVLDPSPDELGVAREAGLETIAGFAEDFDPGDRRWDLVLCCQTIDHVLDVRALLALLRRAVAADGHVYVDVQDVVGVAERKGSLVEVVHIDHPYYLTRETARAFFALAGLSTMAESKRHARFLLAPAEPQEPDWPLLARLAEQRISQLRALA